MILGPRGEALIKGFESLRLEAYLDEKGIPTIGWGHTGPEVHLGLIWTLDQAEAAFLRDTATAVAGVNRTVHAPLAQNQFDALVSFTFNVGTDNEAHSTLVRLINAGQLEAAADEFPKWDHVGKKVSAGLDVRRHAERALWSSQAAGLPIAA